MPFSFGQVYECIEDGGVRQAIVLGTRSNGQEALLRFVDTRIEEWVLWAEFKQAKKWNWIEYAAGRRYRASRDCRLETAIGGGTEVPRRPRFGREGEESRHNSDIAKVKRLTHQRH